jgi:integrase
MGCVQVRGKGGMGGKWRTVRFHPDTLAELEYWLKLRELEVHKAGKDAVDPGDLLVSARGGKLCPCNRTAIDKRHKRVGERIGVKFTNHPIRCTFERSLWLAGVPMETIAQMMGHEDTKTTIDYLSLNMDDQDDAMRKLAQFQSSAKYRVGQNAGCESGQSGISVSETN